jgi:hypothetical protein
MIQSGMNSFPALRKAPDVAEGRATQHACRACDSRSVRRIWRVLPRSPDRRHLPANPVGNAARGRDCLRGSVALVRPARSEAGQHLRRIRHRDRQRCACLGHPALLHPHARRARHIDGLGRRPHRLLGPLQKVEHFLDLASGMTVTSYPLCRLSAARRKPCHG